MNIRKEEALLTPAERLVYAAAFAADIVSHVPSKLTSAKAEAWVAIMVLRDDKTALAASIDWQRVDDMFESFKNSPEVT